MVWRTGLVNQLRAARSVPLAAVIAPPGFGKTVLLAQWAAREERRFFLVDPCAEPVALEVALERAVASVAVLAQQAVFAFDDAHLLSPSSCQVVEELVGKAPGALVALVGRRQPLRSVARLRANGMVIEFGPEHLALNRSETNAMLRAGRVRLTGVGSDELWAETEGWPAGIRLAILTHRRGQADAGADDPERKALSDLLDGELTAGISASQIGFFRRTAFLSRLSGPLCDAVVGSRDSARLLEWMERAGLHVLPLDRERGWFRYHPAFAARLTAENTEPASLRRIREQRAADWFSAHGHHQEALEHASSAGDVDCLRAAIAQAAGPLQHNGREALLLKYVAQLDEIAGLEDHPAVAALGAQLHLLSGRREEAQKHVAAAERGCRRLNGSGASVAARLAVVRAAMCREGLESMLDDVRLALQSLPPRTGWHIFAQILQGTAYALLGETDLADSVLTDAAYRSRRQGTHQWSAFALAERSIVADSRGDRQYGRGLALEARQTIEHYQLQTSGITALALSRSALALIVRGQLAEAKADLAKAQPLARVLNTSLPWLALQVWLEIGNAHVMLRNRTGAQEVLRQIDALFGSCPKLTAFQSHRACLASGIASIPIAHLRSDTKGLTASEFRLLPLLPTNMTYRDMAVLFHLSRNTVKTHSITLYRKLGVANRDEAVARVLELGLVEPTGTLEALANEAA